MCQYCGIDFDVLDGTRHLLAVENKIIKPNYFINGVGYLYNLVNDGWSNSVEICGAFCGIAEWVMTPVALSFSSGDSLISLGLNVFYYQSQQVKLFDESKRTGRGVKGLGVFNEHSIKKPSSRDSV